MFCQRSTLTESLVDQARDCQQKQVTVIRRVQIVLFCSSQQTFERCNIDEKHVSTFEREYCHTIGDIQIAVNLDEGRNTTGTRSRSGSIDIHGQTVDKLVIRITRADIYRG
jgi:hypothetical protein